MDTTAAGQLLGYSMQFPRALVHLLQGREGDVVSIEVIGDVGVEHSDGSCISEEDKSSVTKNPVTDRSKDLWKTFHNWIVAINKNELTIENTHFQLYSNKSGRAGLCNDFSEANDQKSVENTVGKVIEELNDITSGHEIWKYYDFVMNKNQDTFKKLLLNFELIVEEGTAFEQVTEQIKRKHVEELQIDFISDKISGWLVKKVMGLIKEKKPAVVSWVEFDKEMKLILERCRTRELIDFANITMDLVDEHVKIRPRYIKQLDAIELDDTDIIEAVIDYLKADINRSKWIEHNVIDEEIAEEFEDKLLKFWKNTAKRINITNKDYDPIQRGQLILLECQARQEMIRGESPPSSTISGTYHALADAEDLLGWHPDWKDLFKE